MAAAAGPASAATEPAILKHIRFICLNGDIHDFHRFMKLHPEVDLNGVVDTGRSLTPVMLACDNPQATELVRILVDEMKVECNMPRSERRLTPLHMACKAGSDESAMILIDHGVDVTTKDLVGRTALHWASVGSSLDVVKRIVRRAGAAAVDCKDDSEYTPLMYAAEYDRADVAAFLLACGASRTAKNKLSHTAAELADWYGHFDVLKLVDETAWTVAMKAIEQQKDKDKAASASASASALDAADRSASSSEAAAKA